MARNDLRQALRYLHQVLRPASADDETDDQLLSRYLAVGDQSAFAALVHRHGPMVFGLCRRLLGNVQDAEDVFQATFLVLARKAATIRKPESLSCWLHGVAYRLALKARSEAERRRLHERQAIPSGDSVETDLSWREVRGLIDEELQRLPEKQRLPLVLCYLEGLTQDEAARRLGWPRGTLKRRLEAGRERLRVRLTRRGVTLGAGLFAAALTESATKGAVSTALRSATVRAAMQFLTQETAAIAATPAVLLAKGALQTMVTTKLKLGAMVILLLGCAVTAAGLAIPQAPTEKQSEKNAVAPTQAHPKRDDSPRSESKHVRKDRYGDPLPAGAIVRLGTVRLRAVGASVALSPDGKTIIAVIGGRRVQSWDADSGKPHPRRELPFQLSQFFLSNDGRLLAGQEKGFDSPITIWDLVANKRRHQLRFPQGTGIYRAEFSPDGKTLAVSATPGVPKPVVHLWDLASGERRELSGPARTPESLAFSPDGKFLAASDNSRVICWDVARSEKLWQRKCAFGVTLVFTPDGRTLIGSPGHQEHAWHVWNVATGTRASGLKLPEGYNYAHFAVAPDGRTLVFAQSRSVDRADGRVRLWDLRNGKLLHTLKSQGGIGPFFPDGKSFLSNDGALQRWELATGRPLLPETDKLGHRSEGSHAVYSPDGRRLASTAGDGTIRLWDVATAKPLHVLRGRFRDATDLAFAPDGKFLVSGGDAGNLYVWDTHTGNVVRGIPLHHPKRKEKQKNVWQLHLTPDGQTVIVLGYSPEDPRMGLGGILSRFDLASGQRKGRIDIGDCDGFYAGFSPDGGTLASRGELRDTTNGKAREKLAGGPGYLPHYAFSPDGRQVAGHLTRTVQEPMRTTTKMEGIQIWDAATGRARRLLPADCVGQLAFSPDCHYLAAADLQGLRLWELATGKVVMRHKAHERIRGSYGESFASCLSIAPDGRTLATGHLDSTILIWNLIPSSRPATVNELPRLWEELIGTDAARAYAASWRLTDAPREVIHFLQDRLHPVSSASAKQVRPLLADLDSDDFSKREAAAARLRELGDRAIGFLKESLKARPSLEMRRRVEELLKTLEKPPSGETLRSLRAMAILERIGTAEARQVLKTLAQGMPEARVTREAKSALERLTARHPREK